MELVQATFKLRLAGTEVEGQAVLPKGAARISALLPILHHLGDATAHAGAQVAAAEGGCVSCRAGCGACCRQLTPISEHEAHHLAALIAELPPERQQEIKLRFEESCAALERAGLTARLDAFSHLEPYEARRALGAEYFSLGIPCPFLEEESCSIHPHRPMICREYLVTTPAELCRDPYHNPVERVGLPICPSQLLFELGDAAAQPRRIVLPLVFALRWAHAHPESPSPTPAPTLLRRFLEQIEYAKFGAKSGD